ncbi:MAG TPA: AAA family ATPase, partial [Candidatus Limnocylindrales bacterium]|nr:AAA family ATPase [Candidatus Limnocylindrales bacterium]
MSLEIRVLGPLEVLVDGMPLRVDTRKALAILALLAVDGRPYARDELAALCWPESDDESARGALRRTLSVLRAALGGRWLRVDRSTVALDGPDVRVDLAVLDDALAGPGASSDRATLERAAAVARGPFLAGFTLRDSAEFDDWRATRATSIERRVIDVLDRLATAAAATGDMARAADAASRLVELDPLDEPARRRLMTVLAEGGDRAGAIRTYRQTVAVLERELGVPPLAETTALYEAIRDDRLPLRVARPTTPSLVAEPRDGQATGRALPLVGRASALARLGEVYASSTGDGRIVVISGEAGIGKSRLIEALREHVAGAGGTTLAARAFPAEGAIAYAPIAALLQAGFARPASAGRLDRLAAGVLAEAGRLVSLPPGLTIPDPAPTAASPAARARLLDGVAATIEALVAPAGTVPGLVVVEDLQWADDASREAIRYLMRRLQGRPLLLVLSWRPEDLDGPGSAFADAVEALPPDAVVQLDRLEAADVAALVVAASPVGGDGWDATALATESEGLPLYVVEALAAGPSSAGEAPRGVRALLRERLAGVSETAAQVLAAGAVIGRSFELATVRVASGRSEDETIDALEELIRRAIVRETASPGEPRYDFAHARLRDAALEEIGLARLRLLHRRVAEALRTAAGRADAARLVQIATHEQAAGQDAAAAGAWRDAGRLARAVFANREALGHLEAALALGHPDAIGVEVEIGEVRTALGDYAGAIAALEAAAASADAAALPLIELRLGRVHARRGDTATAASHLDAALEATPEGSAERATILVERGAVALRAGDLDLAASLAAAAIGAGASGATAGAAHRLGGLVALRRGDATAARDEL